MSDLRDAVEDYLRIRRALGFKLERTGQLLLQFVDFADRVGADRVTTDLAVTWATQPVNADPAWWSARLMAVRGFAKHQNAIDARTEVPPADVLPFHTRRADPYPYTGDEIEGLRSAARASLSPLKAANYDTLIGLLAVTGMRVGEAIRLDRTDIDWPGGLLTITETKFGKARRLPLHASTVEALRTYEQIRDRHQPHPATDAFFVSMAGTRLIYKNVHRCFHQLARDIGLQPRSEHCRPRIHDLRHRFALLTLTGWYRYGLNIDARLHLLSTYLGHTEPSSTYWYLSATPELLGFAAQRLEAAREART